VNFFRWCSIRLVFSFSPGALPRLFLSHNLISILSQLNNYAILLKEKCDFIDGTFSIKNEKYGELIQQTGNT
jgi:hypothetical protein